MPDREKNDDHAALDELESLALEGLYSGDAIEADDYFWSEMHRRLDELLKAASSKIR